MTCAAVTAALTLTGCAGQRDGGSLAQDVAARQAAQLNDGLGHSRRPPCCAATISKPSACTAARIGEVSGVRKEDIDRDTWMWTVRRQTTPGPGGLIDKGTKGKRARTVPIIEEIRPMVAARLDALTDSQGRLFTGPRGGRISTAVLRDATHWDDVVRDLGFEWLRRHDLRHIGLTWLADAGVLPHVLQKGVEVLPLDITDPASVAAAARAASDVNLLVNNAGVSTGADLVAGDLDLLRRDMDTNYWGTLSVIRAFAPQLAGGAILNVLSALSWVSSPGAGGYAASKAAEWNLTNGVRLELAAQGTLVTGLHLGPTDTDMTAAFDVPKSDPAAIVKAGLDGLEAGDWEVIADEMPSLAKAALAKDPREYYAQR